MSPPRASVIIPTFDGRNHLGPCLDSVLAGSAPRSSYEVVVVDDGSRDGSAAWLRASYPSVRVVELEDNQGFAAAVGAGAAAASADQLVLLNNDTRVHPEWLETLVGALERAPESVASVTGKVLSWDGSRLDFWRGALTFDGHAFQLDFGRPAGSVAAADRPAELPFPCGCNMAVRRAAWEGVGGFDPDFFAYTEDVDFGWRSWLAGWDHRYEPGAPVWHRSGATGAGLGLYRRGYLFEKNAFMTVYKNLERELLDRLMSAILWTLVHRTWTLVELGSPDAATLGSYPFPPRPTRSEGPSVHGESVVGRLRRHGLRESVRRALLKLARRVGGSAADGQRLLVDHPRAVEQLRAVHFLLSGHERLHAAREAVQALRVRSDQEYFARFPLLRVPTYPGDAELFASPAFRALFPPDLLVEDRELTDIGELGHTEGAPSS